MHASAGGALAALISVKLALSIQRNEGRGHKHVILLDFKSAFYKSTHTIGDISKTSKEEEKKGEGGKTGEKPYLCLCLWRKMVVDENEEKGEERPFMEKNWLKVPSLSMGKK